MKWLDLIPTPVYAVAVALLTLAVFTQEARVGALKVSLESARADLASEREARAVEARQRVELVSEHRRQMAQLQADHAAEQQEKENAWHETRLALEARIRTDAAQLDRLRNKLSAYTAGRSGAGASDPASAVDQEHRLETLGGLLQESLELLVEGRRLLERRDAEVMRLLGQIEIDRNACQPGDKKPKPLNIQQNT